MRPWLGSLAGLLMALIASVGLGAEPRPVEFPAPALVVGVSPVPMGLERPRLDPPPAPPVPTPALDLGQAPTPRFISTVTKPLPSVPEPSGFPCAFTFGRAVAQAECGVVRMLAGNYREARQSFEDSLA